MCQSQRAPAPAGVNICFRNLNNRPTVICISDNGPPYGSVDPRCAEALSLSPSLLVFHLSASLNVVSSRPFLISVFFPLSTCPLSRYILLFFLQAYFISVHHPLKSGHDPPHRAVTRVTIAAGPGMPTLCPAQFPASDRKQ